MKKKNFDNFIQNETDPNFREKREIDNIFNMREMDQNLERMELDINSELQKFQNGRKGNNKGVTSKKKNKVSNKEIKHMDKVMNHPEFQKDPFAAIRTHIMNSVDE